MTGRTLLLMGGAALLIPALPAGPAGAASAETAARFAPPTQPLVLTRTLWRGLRDGQEVVVRRRYAVQFVASPAGYLLTGQQIDATVDAPPTLAPIAAVERGRIDHATFPIRLDAAGRILASQPPAAANGADNAAAVAAARAVLRQSNLSATARRDAERQIDRLAASARAGGGAGDWPHDLFSPLARDWSEHRTIALPGGGSGEVTVTVRFVRAAAASLPSAVERTVTTVLDGTTRISREVWTITSA